MFVNENELHASKDMTTKDFENLNLYGKKRMSRPRKKDKKFKTIFAEIKTISETNEKL